MIAVCPDSMANAHQIELTNITLPAGELGTLAVEMTIRRLDGSAEAETRLLAPRLSARGSTTRARRPHVVTGLTARDETTDAIAL